VTETLQTLGTLADRHQIDLLGAMDREVSIPVVAGRPQCQGDLIILPSDGGPIGRAVPPEGVPVIRGEAGGHTHLLVADGPGVTWAAAPAGGQDLGTVHVPAGSTAYLLHPEHGGNGIGAGTCLVRRQREQADEIRMVAD